MGAFRKPPRKSNLNYKSSSLFDPELKNNTGFTLQQSHRSLKGKSQLNSHEEKQEWEPTTPRAVLGTPGATFSVEGSIHGAKHSEQESSLSHRMG
jgi:hypothetical protein